MLFLIKILPFVSFILMAGGEKSGSLFAAKLKLSSIPAVYVLSFHFSFIPGMATLGNIMGENGVW